MFYIMNIPENAKQNNCERFHEQLNREHIWYYNLHLRFCIKFSNWLPILVLCEKISIIIQSYASLFRQNRNLKFSRNILQEREKKL